MRPVVGAAVLRGGRVLAARRTTPAAAAGRWELPGRKVEPGESPAVAVVREVAEELSCAVEVTGWLRGVLPDRDEPRADRGAGAPGGRRAAARRARPAPLARRPTSCDDVDWLEPDRPFLAELAGCCAGRSVGDGRAGMIGPVRGIFFEEDDARAVVARLTGAGFDAAVVRERLAGEDDDEDHPWAVLTDAPALVLELLVDEYDGWLDAEPEAVSPPAPLDLPSAPRRIKRP